MVFKNIKEKFCENFKLFLKFIIILDTIEEIRIFINFQKFLRENQRFMINNKKKIKKIKKI